MRQAYNKFSGRSLERVQGLADGVFAVAMTLLVLDLRLPSPLRPTAPSCGRSSTSSARAWRRTS